MAATGKSLTSTINKLGSLVDPRKTPLIVHYHAKDSTMFLHSTFTTRNTVLI